MVKREIGLSAQGEAYLTTQSKKIYAQAHLNSPQSTIYELKKKKKL